MSYKTVSKNKGKASYGAVAAIGKKLGGPKGFPYGKIVKTAGLNPKADVKVGKAGLNFPQPAPLHAQLHDLGFGVEFGGGLGVLEAEPLTQETELANLLVDELENDSADVNVLCETYDLKREELGRLTGFSLRALAEWASGKLPSQPAKRRLHEVRRLLDALSEIVKRESIKRWLHQPNPAFDRLTPLQVIEVGEMDRLWAMIHEMGAGQPE